MGYIRKKQSKNIKIDSKHPDAIGICSDSGFMFNHKDLVEQKEWRGDRLVGTNQFRGRKYIDEPQEQNRPPLVKNDPRPVNNPRLAQIGAPATFDRTPGQISAQEAPYSTFGEPEAPSYSVLLNKLNRYHWSS